MKALNFLVGVVVLYSFQVCAQNSNAGTLPFDFLRLDYDARTIAMGGASVAMPNGLNGAFLNPASCGFITKQQAIAGYRWIFMDAWGGPVGYALPYKNYGVFSVNAEYVSSGYLDEIDENQNYTGVRWNQSSFTGCVSWAKAILDSFSVGAGIRGIHDYIGSSKTHSAADAIAFEAGGQYRMLNSRLILGCAIRNAGFMLSGYTSATDTLALPLSLALGVSYRPLYLPAVRVALDLQKSIDDYLNYKPGIEVAVYQNYLFVRGGYTFSEQDLEAALNEFKGGSNPTYIKSNSSGLSLGVGLNAPVNGVNTNIDVAYLFRVDDPDPSFLLNVLFEF
jgi:hypothetical protein